MTIPNAADLRCGSRVAAIKSAITCAKTTPKIPATYPFEIIFNNRSIVGLEIFPHEKEHARVEYTEIENHYDPLSSFLNVLIGKKKSKTIDGRRVYSMVVKKQGGNETGETKKILIEDYVNIWADHKRNDLEYIEIKQEYGEGVFSMPEIIKIKFKGLLYKLRRI